MQKRRIVALLALVLPIAALPAKAPPSPATAPGMVSAADPRAAAAGVEILKAGGSAVDAAIATMLALNVVEPQSSGIGGGGFMVHYDAKARRTDGYDGREAAPAAADARWFFGPDGQPLPVRQAIPGGRSVGVPGSLRLMALAHAAHGRLPWARLFDPAIRLATAGFQVTPRMFNSLTNYGGHVDAWAKATFFLPDGAARPVGTTIVNPEQAAFFRRIAAEGPTAFYTGDSAAKLVATVNGAARNPSKMAVADLAAYRARPRPPLCGTYRVYTVCSMAPPSSGGTTMFAILKQLERFDMGRLGKDSAVAWHLFAEASRNAYADRDAYVADPDHVTVPASGLTDPAYLARRAALIAPDRTMAVVSPGQPAGAPPRKAAASVDEHGTTDLVAVDAAGDVAEVTTTVESPWGSGLTVNGVFLNNELTDFDLQPVRDGLLTVNRVEGGKRPRSSMSPTIVYGPDGQVRIALGAAGGSTIIAQVAKALVGVLDWKMSAQDAIAMGLLYAPGPGGVIEQGTDLERLAPALAALGERLRVAPLGLKANAIERVGGRWVGAADPRSEGVSIATDGTVSDPRRTAQPVNAPHE